MEDDLKRTVREVDRKYKVRGKTEQTFKSIREGAQSVDQQYGIRRKLQNLVDDVKRGWPDFKRRAQKFINSPLGQGALFAAVLYGLVSGILFKASASSAPPLPHPYPQHRSLSSVLVAAASSPLFFPVLVP